MPRIHPRRTSRGAVVATLLISGALLAAGTAPADASGALRSIDIQTRHTGASSDVLSVLVTDGGSNSVCVPLIVGAGLDATRLTNGYVVNRILLRQGQSYEAFSYGDGECTDGLHFIGSKGAIDPARSVRWSVYDARPPRAAY